MDKITARMTKDLNGYSDYFAGELDKLIGKRCSELAPLYNRLQKSAVAELNRINKELEKLPEAKRKSKRIIQQLQQQYVDGILPDLELAKAAQDPFVTSTLCGTFEYGYYTQAYSLEQAAKVAVNVPIFNRSGVLGIIANDWVGDGNTYSDRIRRNTDWVATQATKTVKRLVTKRQSYDEAADSLSKAIGESKYNAMRIVRTEMTRANGLGTSYAAMENADILDGKYRDAVRDSRTSGMCAADADISYSDPYPLDYDTPSNPGIPGHRIPNHPNCRCRWRMVVSAVGVNKRAQIARKNDSKDSYGENYYTEATTFDGYAKERGLPSVAEMLEHDNPKRYLRPGETLDSLQQKVKRVKFDGKTVTVPKALWDKGTTNTVKAVDNAVESAIIKPTSTPTTPSPVATVPTESLDVLLDQATTTAEVKTISTNYFKSKPGSGVTSVDFAATDVKAAKAIVTKLDDLDSRFTSSVTVQSKRLRSDIGGQCSPTNASFMDYMTSNNPADLRSEIILNNECLRTRKVIESDFKFNHRAHVTNGVAHSAAVDDTFMDVATLVHEYGHSLLPGKANEILLANGGTNNTYVTARRIYRQYTDELKGIKHDIQQIRDSFSGQPNGLQLGIEATKDLQAQYSAMCISEYSKSSVGEFIAEAFCDYELSSNPKPYSKKIHDLLVKAFGKDGTQ